MEFQIYQVLNSRFIHFEQCYHAANEANQTQLLTFLQQATTSSQISHDISYLSFIAYDPNNLTRMVGYVINELK